MEQGKIFKFHNDLDTDQIIASQYLLLPNLDEMKGHAFESLDPDFAKKVKPGDFVVGGENFGCGSSREQAPGVLKALGVQAVIAKSFARIFFRNAINIGLPAIVCKDLPDAVENGDTMILHMSEGTAEVNGKTYTCTKLYFFLSAPAIDTPNRLYKIPTGRKICHDFSQNRTIVKKQEIPF